MDVTGWLMQFGLTLQEARIYACLHRSGRSTGYELAKVTGISRSNTYAGLSSLVEKGAAHKADGKPVRYVAVPVDEFCKNIIRELRTVRKLLEKNLPGTGEADEGYLTIQGPHNIRNKIENLIADTEHRIYISMPYSLLEPLLPSLTVLLEKGKKVVVITDGPLMLDGAILYRAAEPAAHIRIIRDTAVALTGNLDDTPGCSCLYSAKENLVSLLRDSMRGEIRLIELAGEGAAD